MSENQLVFLPLGGSGEIGMNLNLYGFGPAHNRKWLIIDCGVMFGDLKTPGIDIICPDIGFLEDNRRDIVGLVLTHGHEDHLGAVALLAPQLKCPIYATPFTAALLKRKYQERGETMSAVSTIKMGSSLTLGPFELELITLTHSIPEPSGVLITTELGSVLHTGDWKIDKNPTLGPKVDKNRLQKLGDEGIIAMICDSTNVFSLGESGSETSVRNNLKQVIARQTGRIAVTTFASNVSRVVSICEAARAYDRSVCLLGRSMLKIVDAAREAEILPEGLTFVSPEEAGYIPRENILYLCTGSQGESRAALGRIARDEHRDLVLSSGDTVIFSSKIIPGNERDIFNLQNTLVDMGVKVITEKDEDIHVSGHPCRDELSQMYRWVRPSIAIPVHGEARHLEEHAELALALGAKQAIAPRNGHLIHLAPGPAKKVEELPTGRLYLDGARLIPAGATQIKERHKLGYAGVCSVSLVISKNSTLASPPQVSLFGTPRSDDNIKIVEEAIEEITEHIRDLAPSQRLDDSVVTIAVKRAIRDVMDDMWGKRPIMQIQIHRGK